MEEHNLTNEQILAFSTALFQAERSQATVEKYLRSVRAIFLYLNGQPVTKDTVLAWKKYLQREENYSPSTVNASLIAHNGTHGETGAVSDGGGITTLGAFRTFTNIPGPGIRTASFAAFGAWSGVLPKNAESLRNSDALMRVAVPRRRGPAGLRDLFRFCRNCGLYTLRSELSACMR